MKRKFWTIRKSLVTLKKLISVDLQKPDTVNNTQISGKNIKKKLEYTFKGLSEKRI